MKMFIALLVAMLSAGCSISMESPSDDQPTEPPMELSPAVHPNQPTSGVTACAATDDPCVISVVEPLVSGQPVLVEYELCCPAGTIQDTILEVSGHGGERNWGDVTRWGLCGHRYVEEFVVPLRTGPTPYAILSVFDGNGGPISECRTSKAPPPIR